MARATRAKPAPKEPTPESIPSTTPPLPEATSNPPKLFILPKDTSSDARIVTLDNPAASTPSRYYFCPSKGFYEFSRIAAPKKACRSWLITSQEVKTSENEKSKELEEPGKQDDSEAGLGSGYTTKNADLFLATPVDLLFLILPALAPKSAKEEKQHFLALDDYTDMLSASSQHWKTLLAQHPSLKLMLERKMRTLCDTVDAGVETMYRISHAKLLAILVKKAERMVQNSLPPSMEEKFVKSALDIPVMSIRREDSTLSAVSESGTSTPAADSQASTTAEAESQATDITTPDKAEVPAKPSLQTPEGIPHLLRLRTALSYLTSSYLPPSLVSTITTLLSTPTSPIDFTPLTAHLSTIAKLKSEAAALRSISDNISRKRQFECNEDKIAEREEKKRKKEEEDRKKKSESLGVKKLRKVDTTGMKKMSAFFSVKPKAK
ncbi:hypothetical protein BU25DRAFT_12838 [Macroventuria anomochaeta]|uniref:Uncharacterized protein n=1 Tax=Macroventuria anomochaeta TaxID=301207 RepID=A0ACB6SK88_9PLEO|nr:uncharacterized protein BU25DRAFT_12838 [Macroventuria anomochaeta]KAF2633787.1 hypothetical protein BU25DRAFT_12838 [Macroventuria anomochaeta]